MTLFPLHGFLGTPMDWEMLLPSQQHLTYICRSLYDPSFTPPEKGLVAWGDSFNVFAKKAAPPPRYQRFFIGAGSFIEGLLSIGGIVCLSMTGTFELKDWIILGAAMVGFSMTFLKKRSNRDVA